MLCSTLRRAAVGQRACAKCSVRANSLILATKPRSGTDRPLRTRVRNSRPGLLPTRAFTGASKPHLFVPERGFVSIFGRFFCTIAAEPMASGKPTRKGARILCADSEREGLLCADSAGEGLDDGRNPRLGWRGRKRAALLPARSETHGQSAPRRPGSSLPVRAAIRCPPPCFSRQGQLGHPPPSSVTDPDPMGSSGGGDRHQVTLRRGADRPSRTALCPCPRRRSGCVADGRAFPGRAGPPSRRMRGKSAARSRFSSQPACTFP